MTHGPDCQSPWTRHRVSGAVLGNALRLERSEPGGHKQIPAHERVTLVDERVASTSARSALLDPVESEPEMYHGAKASGLSRRRRLTRKKVSAAPSRHEEKSERGTVPRHRPAVWIRMAPA